MAQRNLTAADVYYVYEHGICFIRAGVLHIFLGKKCIPTEDRRNQRICQLVGTTVQIDSRDAMTVKTAYRNRESLKKDRRKAKYDYRKSNPSSLATSLPLAA